jgi:hypothetical protein
MIGPAVVSVVARRVGHKVQGSEAQRVADKEAFALIFWAFGFPLLGIVGGVFALWCFR